MTATTSPELIYLDHYATNILVHAHEEATTR
jgi:hypothetical protein